MPLFDEEPTKAVVRPGPDPGFRPKTSSEIDEEARQVYEMVLMGMRQDQIAQSLGISHGTVTNRRKRGAELAVVPKVEQYRAESAARIDGFMRALIRDNPKVTPRVVEASMALETRRAKLYGMDMPAQIEITQTVIEGGVDAEVARLAEEMGLGSETPVPEDAEL